jgi:hypothetical protein
MSAWNRRRFLTHTAAAGAAVVGDLGFLANLPPVSAEELQPGPVRFTGDAEPVVRLLEDIPRERVLEAVAGEIRSGKSYTELLRAILLAGVRNIRPRPVGFKFHAVLAVNSAHLAAMASPGKERWLPLFWAIDTFKASQARDVQEGDWMMPQLAESALPSDAHARQRFIQAMDRWDEPATDVAIARLARVEKPAELYELFWRYGARDFRDIGHKAIYVANSRRTFDAIGWENAEPVLRSLAYALLARDRVNPAEADELADRPWRLNLDRMKGVSTEKLKAWQHGKPEPAATKELLAVLRTGAFDDACATVATQLARGVAHSSLWDAVLAGAGELIMRQPGLVGIHCVTTANALHYGSQATRSDETRVLLLLQGAAFMTLFRQTMERGKPLPESFVDALPPAEGQGTGPEGVEAIFAAASRDRMDAARRTVAYLDAGGSAEALVAAGRRLIFLKGRDSHDYKFSSAALEDYAHVSPGLRNRYLATAMFNLKGSADPDNPLAARTRAALEG